MALYIAFIASFNLCIGYVLGVYIGVLPGVTRRESLDEQEEPIALATAAPASEAAPSAPVESAKPAPQAEPAHESQPSVVPVPSLTPPEQHANIMEGLEVFRSKLNQVTAKLSEVENDKQVVDECATEVKQANTQYLKKATEALDSLNAENSKEVDQQNNTLRVTITQQTAEVRQANDEIDDILAEDDPAKARQRLLDSTAQLSVSASKAQQAIPASLPPTAPPPVVAGAASPTASDGVRGLDLLLAEIDASLAGEAELAPLQVAAIDLEADNDPARNNMDRIFAALENIVAGELTDAQHLAIDDQGRLLLLLAGDSEADANQRCERIRQMFAATKFKRDGEKLATSLRCAVADNLRAASAADVISRLDESLAESRKVGVSRTFHHDGTIAAPVVAEVLDVDSQEVEI